VARALVRSSYAGSRAIVTVRRGSARIDVRSSIFCGVREPVPEPLCGFYAAATVRVLELLHVGAVVDVAQCRGTGQPACVLRVRTDGAPATGSSGASDPS